MVKRKYVPNITSVKNEKVALDHFCFYRGKTNKVCADIFETEKAVNKAKKTKDGYILEFKQFAPRGIMSHKVRVKDKDYENLKNKFDKMRENIVEE